MFHVKPLSLESQPEKREKLTAYAQLLQRYNRQINLLSRRTTTQGYLDHIIECLSFATYPFLHGSSVADWGTGGGLPAIPLAIMHPDLQIYGVEAVQKKIFAIQAFKRELDLTNLHPWHGRAEEFNVPIEYSVSRGTTSLKTLWEWHEKNALAGGFLLSLKGGNLKAEYRELNRAHPTVEIMVNSLPKPSRFLVKVYSVDR